MARTPATTVRVGLTLLVAAAIVTIAVALWSRSGYLDAMDPAPYAPVLDELHFPSSWSVPHEDVAQAGAVLAAGPSVSRFYLVDADPKDTVTIAEHVATDAGFTVDRGFSGTCSRHPEPNGPIARCYVTAVRGTTRLSITIFARGERISYSPHGDGPEAGAPNLSVVRVQAGRQL